MRHKICKVAPIHSMCMSHSTRIIIFQVFYKDDMSHHFYKSFYEIRERYNSYIDNIKYRSKEFKVNSLDIDFNIDDDTKSRYEILCKIHDDKYKLYVK